MLRGSLAERMLPVIAVALGLGHAAFLGGLATPVAFTRAVLAVGVLCPLMMGMSSARVGRRVLRPRSRLLVLMVSLGLGPALALVIGKSLLQNYPEQATALLLLALVPGSALVPIWACATRACGSTAIALTWTGWAIATFVSLPIVAGSFASVASLVALRDLALVGVIPLAVGGACRVALSDALEPEEYARDVQPVLQTVVQASLAVLLFTSTASAQLAVVLRREVTFLPALMAVALLYLGLFLTCGGVLLAFRRRLSRAAARATMLATTTRQTALAMSVLPLVVAPSALPSAVAIPLCALVLELVAGATALAMLGSWATAPSTDGARDSRRESLHCPE
ncbi:MAG TPA: hypothetical protein VKP30_17295 [Polyangiaceae bacterium]|nr:hypothetical protein [Polyangiaceae bacterium]